MRTMLTRHGHKPIVHTTGRPVSHLEIDDTSTHEDQDLSSDGRNPRSRLRKVWILLQSCATMVLHGLSWILSRIGITIKSFDNTPSLKSQLHTILCKSKWQWGLLLIPAGFAVAYSRAPGPAIFAVNIVAMVPSIMSLSLALDNLILYLGDITSALVSSTFSNIATAITCFLVLRAGDVALVQTTLVGTVISNVLLMPGLCFIAGGLLHKEQCFSTEEVRIMGGQLLLAVFSVLQVTGFRIFSPDDRGVLPSSRGLAVTLSCVYFALLAYQLRMPRAERSPLHTVTGPSKTPELSLLTAICSLAVFTVLLTFNTSFATDQLAAVKEPDGPLSSEFLGLVILPVLSNDPTLLWIAWKNELDLILALTIGKSVQVLLVIFPLLIIISWASAGLRDLDYNVDGWQMMNLTVATLAVNYIVQDGRTNWSYGVLLIALFFVIALVAWYYPFSETLG